MRPLLLVFLAGCGTETVCTEIGFVDSLTLDFEPLISEPGGWTFTATTENGARREVVLDLPAEDGSVGSDDTYIVVDRGVITQFVLLSFTPNHLDVAVKHDGVDWSSASVDPEYVEDEPNGEGCGVQRIGTATVEL